MAGTEPDLGHPLEAQRVGLAVGCAVLGLIAIPVALVVEDEPYELMAVLAVGLVMWTVFMGLSRVLSRRPVVPDAGIRCLTGPMVSDWTAAFASGLRHALLVNGAICGVCGLACWALGSLAVLPLVVLGSAGQFAVEVVDLRRWQSDHGVVLHAKTSSRGFRLIGPRDADRLVAVVVASRLEDRVATQKDRS